MPGTKMGKADGLSRRSDWKVGVEKDNENQVFIKDNWIHSLQEVVIEGLEVELLEKIKKARSKDEDVVRVVEEMKKTKVKEIRENKWKIEGELLLKKGKVYVPKDKELRAEVIQLHYDITRLFLLLALHRSVHTPFLLSIQNLPLSATLLPVVPLSLSSSSLLLL